MLIYSDPLNEQMDLIQASKIPPETIQRQLFFL